jgi:hypothetical protein
MEQGVNRQAALASIAVRHHITCDEVHLGLIRQAAPAGRLVCVLEISVVRCSVFAFAVEQVVSSTRSEQAKMPAGVSFGGLLVAEM